MGLISFFARKTSSKALTGSPEFVEALNERRVNPYPRLGGTNNQQIEAAFQRGIDASYGWIYRTQPAVRSVVDYIARNSAQLGLKLYERVSDTERERREDHPAAQTMAHPDEETPSDAFIFRLIADWLVYDNAYALKFRPGVGGKLTLVRLPPEMVTVAGGRFTPTSYRIWRRDGSFFDAQPENLLHWKGYNPQDPLMGLSKLETLREELASDAATQATLVELAKNGLKGGHVERPIDAPEWTPEALARWQEEWKRQKRTREDPVLEEGMKYVQDSITPKDAELLSARQFTKQEVADAYGIPMKALMEGSQDARKSLYADVLPPITKALACQLNVSILLAEYSATDYYFEFDLNEKLRGDAEARFSAITAAAGRPWLTVNEVRAMENKPPIDGGDELTIPLNVMLAGQGSPALPAPNVMPIQDPTKPPQDGSYREQPKQIEAASAKGFNVSTTPERHAALARQKRAIDKATATVERFYARQERSLKSKGEKAIADSARWNGELSGELEQRIREIVELEGGITVARLGGTDFDMRQVEHYLKAMAEGTAEGINGATQRDISESGVSDALKRAREERASIAGTSIGTRATAFARTEAAKQAPGTGLRVKTWIADTDRHMSLDGVSVALESDWGGIEPGTEPNCACGLFVE